MKPAETPDPKENPAVDRVDRRGGVMRKHRVALVVSIFCAAVVAVALSVTYPGASAPNHTEDTSWITASPPTRTMLLSSANLEPIAVFAAAYNAWQFSTYVNDELAAARAAAERATIHIAPSTAPTYQSTPSSNSAIWSCIIQHESGGNPNAVNPSSGAGGLFQFELGTWQANGGAGYPQDASVTEQWAIATATEARDGWSPWIGDGCTPLG